MTQPARGWTAADICTNCVNTIAARFQYYLTTPSYTQTENKNNERGGAHHIQEE